HIAVLPLTRTQRNAHAERYGRLIYVPTAYHHIILVVTCAEPVRPSVHYPAHIARFGNKLDAGRDAVRIAVTDTELVVCAVHAPAAVTVIESRTELLPLIIESSAKDVRQPESGTVLPVDHFIVPHGRKVRAMHDDLGYPAVEPAAHAVRNTQIERPVPLVPQPGLQAEIGEDTAHVLLVVGTHSQII